MRYFPFSVFLLSFILGCGNQPLELLIEQSDRHSSEFVEDVAECYKGLAIDREAAEYHAIFDKMCVDGVLTGGAATGGLPELPEGVTPLEIEKIVSDVAAGNTDYKHKWIYVEGLVIRDLTDGSKTLSLETDTDDVQFRVAAFVKDAHLSRWKKGTRYGFILEGRQAISDALPICV